MARDDGHGERHWVRLLLRGPVQSVVLASAYSLWSTTPRPWQLLGDWDRPSSCVSLRLLLKVFPLLCARAVRTWNLVHFLRVLVSGSHCSGCLGVADEYEDWILRETTFFVK